MNIRLPFMAAFLFGDEVEYVPIQVRQLGEEKMNLLTSQSIVSLNNKRGGGLEWKTFLKKGQRSSLINFQITFLKQRIC
jgi:hypothetical protein